MDMTSEYLIGTLHFLVHEHVETLFIGKYPVPVEFMCPQIMKEFDICHFTRVHRIGQVIIGEVVSHGQAHRRQPQIGADEGHDYLRYEPGLRHPIYFRLQLKGAEMEFSE